MSIYDQFTAKDSMSNDSYKIKEEDAKTVQRAVLTGSRFKRLLQPHLTNRRLEIGTGLKRQLARSKGMYHSAMDFLDAVKKDYDDTPVSSKCPRMLYQWYMGTTAKETDQTFNIDESYSWARKSVEQRPEGFRWSMVDILATGSADKSITGSHKSWLGNLYELYLMSPTLNMLGFQEVSKCELEHFPDMCYAVKQKIETGTSSRECDFIFRYKDIIFVVDVTCANTGNPEILKDHEARYVGAKTKSRKVKTLIVCETIKKQQRTDYIVGLDQNMPLALTDWINKQTRFVSPFTGLTKTKADALVQKKLSE